MVYEKNEVAERIKDIIEGRQRIELTGSIKERDYHSEMMRILLDQKSDINTPSFDISLQKAAETRSTWGMFSALVDERKQREKRDKDDRWWLR